MDTLIENRLIEYSKQSLKPIYMDHISDCICFHCKLNKEAIKEHNDVYRMIKRYLFEGNDL